MNLCSLSNKKVFRSSIMKCLNLYSIMIALLRVTAGESMIPRPCFRISNRRLFTVLLHIYFCNIYFRSQLLFTIIYTTCILISLRRTSAPIHLTSVLGVLGTQETSCILIAGLLERNIFDLCLPEFDKPWVIHLRETCCYSTNLCTWRPTLSTRIEACVDITLLESRSTYPSS